MAATTENPKKPPPYGSKEYWEQRYQKNLKFMADGTLDSKTESADDGEDDNPNAFHSWYFSYDELKPLLLPLILGGRSEVQRILGSLDDDNNDDDDDDDEDDDDEGKENAEEGHSSDIHENGNGDKQQHTTERSNDSKEALTKPSSGDEDGSDVDENQDEKDEWAEVEEDENDAEDDGADQEISQSESSGLAVQGPISVLEVGCGDVPLGTALADDMANLETQTGAQASNILKRVVCTDYSSTVIDMMTRLNEKKRKMANDGTSERKEFPVEFTLADARELPYPDGSFHLVIDKGTMDAMLSDTEVGISNCVKIVKSCARILTVGGCFFLISHVNAHTIKGEEWLDEVIVPGLKEGGGGASWVIEVHGSDLPSGENDDIPGPPESPGPAVYMIFKGAEKNSEEESEPPAISLKFFTY